MTSIRALPALVSEQFKAAQVAGDLTFYKTQVSVLLCDGVPFQLRFSPALANKPKSNKPSGSIPIDVFETPQKGLFISDLPPSHFLVLNKFPVIPNHFILATKEFKKQTDLLEQDDLAAAYSCLKAYQSNGEELFGFFNSGEYSGASQSHRHIQFLPVESMRSGLENGLDWNVLADTLTNTPRPGLPFTYFSSIIPADSSPEQLYEVYISLHLQACSATGLSFSPESTAKSEESPISYNLGLTDQAMVLCPRTSEGLCIKGSEGRSIGPIALNGTVLGGTLLVKNEEEWNALCNDGEKLKTILHAIGIPPSTTSHGERL